MILIGLLTKATKGWYDTEIHSIKWHANIVIIIIQHIIRYLIILGYANREEAFFLKICLFNKGELGMFESSWFRNAPGLVWELGDVTYAEGLLCLCRTLCTDCLRSRKVSSFDCFMIKMMIQAKPSTNMTKQALLMFVLGLPQDKLKKVCNCRSLIAYYILLMLLLIINCNDFYLPAGTIFKDGLTKCWIIFRSYCICLCMVCQ